MGKCPLNWCSRMDRILVGIVTRGKEMESEGKPREWNRVLQMGKQAQGMFGRNTEYASASERHTYKSIHTSWSHVM